MSSLHRRKVAASMIQQFWKDLHCPITGKYIPPGRRFRFHLGTQRWCTNNLRNLANKTFPLWPMTTYRRLFNYHGHRIVSVHSAAVAAASSRDVDACLHHVITYFCLFGPVHGEALVRHCVRSTSCSEPTKSLLQLCPACFQQVRG